MLPPAVQQPPSASRALGCLVANLLLAPGLGTALAGRPLTGAGQFTLALTGVLFFGAWFLDVMRQAYALAYDTISPRLHHWLAIVGLALFGAAWVWSLLTGLAILRAARAHERAALLATPPPVL